MALTKIGKEGVTGISNSSNATAITIDSSENVGIDFTPKTMNANVTSSLNVGSGTLFQRTKDTYLASNTYYNASDAGTSISTGYGLVYYQDVTNGAHKWFTSAASAGSADAAHSFTIPMTLDSSGNLLIGVSSFTSGGGGVQLGGTQATREFSVSGTGAIQQIGFHNPNGEVGSIYSSSSSTVFATSSDYRLKENIDYTWDATARLKQLKPARFNFIADDTNTLIDGFIAHEAATVVPEAVIGTKDAVDEEGNIKPQGIDASKLVPLLVKTIQELEARITALETA